MEATVFNVMKKKSPNSIYVLRFNWIDVISTVYFVCSLHANIGFSQVFLLLPTVQKLDC